MKPLIAVIVGIFMLSGMVRASEVKPDLTVLKYVNIYSDKTSKTSLFDLFLKAKAYLTTKGLDVAPIEHSVAFEIVGEQNLYLEISFLAPPGSPSFGVMFNRKLEIVDYKVSEQ